MVVYRFEQRWHILRHYFENYDNVAECVRKLRTDFGRRKALYVRYLVKKVKDLRKSADKDKCYANKPETIDASKDNIGEAIGEIQLHAIDNVLKNWVDRVG